MNKLKITVYAICKNEEQFVDRWYESMKEADEIVVLDTGSSDNTVSKLKSHGIKVESKAFCPFRFDEARNESLKLVSSDTDICVCTDLDEVFESGWRKKLEDNWNDKTKLLKYIYVWNVLENGEDGITFMYEKIHAREGFKWIYPVHEILQSDNKLDINEISICKSLVLRHFPDPNKSRGQYLELLELSVKEHPESDRNTHYLAREYMFKARFTEAIKTFKKHLKLKSATWREERSASLRYIGDCYTKLNKKRLAEKYYLEAIKESFFTREAYLSLAELYYKNKEYLKTIFTLNSMLEIKTKQLTYITNPDCWNYYPYDLLAICYFNLKNINYAIFYTQKALELSKDNQRLKNNLSYYYDLLKNKS